MNYLVRWIDGGQPRLQRYFSLDRAMAEARWLLSQQVIDRVILEKEEVIVPAAEPTPSISLGAANA